MLGLPGLPEIISRAIILLVALPVHELAHAITAVRLGDDTPRRQGRLTLNPLAHLDLLGSILIFFAGFGWAKPVMVNPYYLRGGPGLGMAVVAAAGPLSNLALAALAALPLRFGLLDTAGSFARGVAIDFIFINLVLLLFNLIPIAPLDGSKILRAFAPSSWDRLFMQLDQWGPFLLMALLFLGRGLLGVLIGEPARALFALLVGR